MAIRVINGIGTGLIKALPSGDAPPFEVTLPLTMQNGYVESWDDRTITHELISLDTANLAIEERQLVIDGFGNWIFDYSNLPMPVSFVKNVVKLWNLRGRYEYTLYPKYQNQLGVPDRSFVVNMIGTEGLTFQTGDSELSPGTFGIKLLFRTKQNQQISVAEATGILPDGGSYAAPYEGSN
jgi:hypothetical protein